MKREPKGNALQRIKDANEFLSSATDNLEKGKFKVCVDNAIDAMIAANDAFTIGLIEQLATSDHGEAIRLHVEAGRKINANQSSILKQMLDLRHQKTYRPVSVSKNLAEESLRKATKFVRWIEGRIKI
jgi:uncharacterized protein (UPF0332 family)